MRLVFCVVWVFSTQGDDSAHKPIGVTLLPFYQLHTGFVLVHIQAFGMILLAWHWLTIGPYHVSNPIHNIPQNCKYNKGLELPHNTGVLKLLHSVLLEASNFTG